MTRIRTVEEVGRLVVHHLHHIRALAFDVIVHMPRSGTLPAALISTHLNMPLASVEEFCAGIVYTRRTTGTGQMRVLLVDDLLRSGAQMHSAEKAIRRARPDVKITKLVVFSSPNFVRKQFTHADHVLCAEPDADYMYPWFLFKSKRVKGYAFDMDGVLCRDVKKREDDDGPAYAGFLASAAPRFLTTHPLGWIVTSRLERYRPETERWLKRNGVKYGELIMGPWATKAERRAVDVGAWKAKVYASLESGLFVESSLRQSKTIHAITGKPVWCVDAQVAFQKEAA